MTYSMNVNIDWNLYKGNLQQDVETSKGWDRIYNFAIGQRQTSQLIGLCEEIRQVKQVYKQTEECDRLEIELREDNKVNLKFDLIPLLALIKAASDIQNIVSTPEDIVFYSTCCLLGIGRLFYLGLKGENLQHRKRELSETKSNITGLRTEKVNDIMFGRIKKNLENKLGINIDN